MPTDHQVRHVRQIARAWAWNIREDGRELPPDMLRLALVETARALDDIVREMDSE